MMSTWQVAFLLVKRRWVGTSAPSVRQRYALPLYQRLPPYLVLLLDSPVLLNEGASFIPRATKGKRYNILCSLAKTPHTPSPLQKKNGEHDSVKNQTYRIQLPSRSLLKQHPDVK